MPVSCSRSGLCSPCTYSEARRHNALIRASALDEPLKPLLRPATVVAAAADGSAASTSAMSTGGSARATVGSPGIPTPPSTIGGSTARRVASKLSVITRTADSRREGEDDLGDEARRTISPLFPRDLATLVALGPGEVRALVRDYGLVDDGAEPDEDGAGTNAAAGQGARRGGASGGPGGSVRGARSGNRATRPVSTFTNASDASNWDAVGLSGSREDDLNKFMRHIGVSMLILRSKSLC